MSLRKKLEVYRKKSSTVQVLNATVFTLSLVIGLLLVFALLEHAFWFESTVRSLLFYILLFILISLIISNLIPPLLVMTGLRKPPEDEQTAKAISEKIAGIEDQLINYLQLEKEADNALARAGAEQKGKGLSNVDFNKAIDYTALRKYSRVLIGVVVILVLLAIWNPPMITASTARLVKYNTSFVRPAPFEFVILNDSLRGFKNKSFELKVELKGEYVPSELILVTHSGLYPLTRRPDRTFSYTFLQPDESVSFRLEAAGYSSRDYTLEMLSKPVLNLMSIELSFPAYTKMPPETLNNSGNLSVPYGTMAEWTLTANSAREAWLVMNDSVRASRLDESTFVVNRPLTTSGSYQIILQNEHAQNEEALTYTVNVLPDEAPNIEVEFLADTTSFDYVVMTGQISDDYGFHSLELNYELGDRKFSKPLAINKNQRQQGYFAEWMADSAQINPGENLSIYLTVRDNDQLAGYKAVRSSVFTFYKPTLNELSDAVDKKGQSAEEQLEKALDETKALREALNELAKKLKSDNQAGWQEEKLIQEALEKRQELEKMLQELKEKHDDLLKANENFQQSEQLQEKSQQLNELFEELMDESTRQLYEELQKMLQEKRGTDEMRNSLEQISRQENRMMKDLERTKELLKRLKLESGLERIQQQLDSMASNQEKLSQKPQDSSSRGEQEDLLREFQELGEDMEKMEQLNQDLKKPEPLEEMDADKKEVEQEMQKALENMKNSKPADSKKNQQRAAEQMRQMSKKMQTMQAGMEMEVMQENIGHLRMIMDDLIKLSFKQEQLIGSFREVNPSDPRFITLSQDQLKMKDDLKVISDSLTSLASRVVQLSSFITREVDEIDVQLNSAIDQLRERQQGRAMSHQQFAMTSMNNLALLLDDVLQQMQMSMSESMGKGQSDKPSNRPQPSLGELQQQLGEQIQQLKDGQKSGKELSEELARLAAEQEMIRQQLQELQEKLGGQMDKDNLGDDLGKAIKLMEQNELDLVNKRLTQQLMNRQKEITTRLLEAENALKEQQQDPEREGETAKQRERVFPPKFEEYLRERKKEIELLRNVPLELKPFYKKEVNDYFRRISEKNP